MTDETLRSRQNGGGDDEGRFGGGKRGGALQGGQGRGGGVGFARADTADILAGDDDGHDGFVIGIHGADLLEDLGGGVAVVVQPIAVQTRQDGAVGVVVEHGGVRKRQRAGGDLRFAGVFLARQAGLLGGAAFDGAAQGKDGAFVVAGTVVDDADLTVGVGVVGVDLEGAIGIARGCHSLTAADVGVGDGHVGDGVLDAELLVEADGFGEELESGVVLLQEAVEHAGANVEKGQVGSDFDGFLVPLDGEVVFAEDFVDVGLHAAHIHQILAVAASLGDVVLRLGELVLVDEDFGVVGFGEGVGGIELDGGEGFSFGLVAVVFGHVAGKGWVGEPAKDEGAHGEDVGIGRLGFFGSVDDGEGLVEAVAAFLVGGEAGGGVGEDAGELDAHSGVVGLEDQCFVEGFDRFGEVSGLEVGFAFGEEGVDRAGGGGGGDERRPDLAAGVVAQDGDEHDDDEQDEHDAVGVGAVARIAEEVLAFVDVHVLVACFLSVRGIRVKAWRWVR